MESIIRNLIIGTKLKSFGRSCDLLWFKFENEKRTVSVHIQCPTRIINKSDILVTDVDIYSAFDNNDEDFKWDKFGKSVYDIVLGNFLAEKDYEVSDFIKLNELNDYSIVLSDGLIIEMLNNKSLSNERERWRMIINNHHYVLQSILQEG